MEGGLAEAEGPDLLLNRVIEERFHIEKLLAQGAVGKVYLATQVPLGRLVAIKILSTKLRRANPKFGERFFREAAISSKLSHPNIVSIFDYGETSDGLLWMAMEYLHGRPLSEVIEREGPFSPERTVGVAMQVCRAARKAHEMGVIHRDLKPANIMLCTGEEQLDLVKVLDFGLVKHFGRSVSGSRPITALPREMSLTGVGALVGTPLYMAPEQALGDPADPRADIYSLGVVLFHMIAGRPPFIADTHFDVIGQHLGTEVPRICDLAPNVSCPGSLEEIVRRCLEKMPERRFQSMNDLLEALKDLFRSWTEQDCVTEVSNLRVWAENLAEPSRSSGTRAEELPRPRVLRARTVVLIAALAASIGLAVSLGRDGWTPRYPGPARSPPRIPPVSSARQPGPSPAPERAPPDPVRAAENATLPREGISIPDAPATRATSAKRQRGTTTRPTPSRVQSKKYKENPF